MTASKQAKSLGVDTLKNMAEFYQCTVMHLHNISKRNNDGFVAMCRGYVIYLEKN